MKKLIIMFGIIFLVFLYGCYAFLINIPIDNENNDPIQGEVDDQVVFDYLNQTVPVDVASRFVMPNANKTWFWSGPPVFSPDGKQVYWTKIHHSWDETEIWYKTRTEGVWSTEQQLTIDGVSGFISCPVFGESSDELYFKHQSLEMEISIMKVTRIDDDWVNPITIQIPIPSGYTLDGRFSIADNKNIYFTLLSISGMEHMKIYSSKFVNGQYETPQAIDIINGNTFGSSSPYIAKDESFILYDSGPESSYGVQDIYVSFIDDYGNFMNPINLGIQVNSMEEENSVIISEDGKYLFFSSRREDDVFYTPYWIALNEIGVFK